MFVCFNVLFVPRPIICECQNIFMQVAVFYVRILTVLLLFAGLAGHHLGLIGIGPTIVVLR